MALGVFHEDGRAFCDSVDASREPTAFEFKGYPGAEPDPRVCRPLSARDEVMRVGSCRKNVFAMSWNLADAQSRTIHMASTASPLTVL